MSSVLALIPARSGSKGVPDKNVRPLGGQPLIAWSIAAATRSQAIDRVIVSTDSDAYGRIAIKHGAEVPFLRPSELAADCSRDLEFILHALDWLDDRGEERGTEIGGQDISGLLHGDQVIPFVTDLALEVDVATDFDLLEYHLKLNPGLFDELFG